MYVDGETGTHGVSSRYVFPQVARAQKRRIMAHLDLRHPDIKGTPLPLFIDSWARAQARVELYDRWLEAHDGGLDDSGKEPPFMRNYFAALRAVQQATRHIADEMERRGRKDARRDLYDFIEGQATEIGPG